MKIKRIVLVILIITCTTLWNINLTNAADFVPLLKFSADDVYVVAGQENEIKITLKNMGNWNIYETKISLTAPINVPGLAVVENSHMIYNIIEDGESKTFFPVIYVDKNTPLGTYSLTLTATYMKKVQYSVSMMESMSLQVGIIVDRVLSTDIKLNPNVDDASLTAGIENPITISLMNIGNEVIYDLDATIMSTSPYIVITEGSRFTANRIEENRSISHPSILRVSRNAPLGVYTLTETIIFKDVNGQSYHESFSLGFYINNSKPDPILDLFIDNPRLTGGLENTIQIKIQNNGDEGIYYLDTSLSSTTPFITILENTSFTQEEVFPGDETKFESILGLSRNIPIGVYTLTATSSFRDSEGHVSVKVHSLGVSVSSLEIVNETSIIMSGYDTSLDTLRPGDNFDLKLRLETIGAQAYDVKTSLSLDPLTGISIMSPTTVSLGKIEPGIVEEALFGLLIGGEVKAGQYPAMVSVSYLGSDGMPRSLMESVTISIRGLVNFRLINEDQVQVGKSEQTEFEADLLLVGTESVQFVSIEIVEDSIVEHVKDSEEYIGAVDPDSPIPFELSFKVSDDAELGKHNIKLRIIYTDDLNQEHEVILDLDIDVIEPSSNTTQTQGSTGGFWVWLRRIFGLGP